MTQLTTVHLVRHGEVDNPDGIIYGRRDGFHLTALGHAMAEGVGRYFADRDVRAVIASPLERAMETAAPTARRHGLEVRTDARLLEAGNRFEGVNVNRNRWVLARPKYWSWYLDPFLPGWGEPYREITERMSGAVRAGITAARGGEAVLVSHQLPIWVERLFVERRSVSHDPRHRQCSLCSVTSLTFEGRRLIAVDYAEPVADLLASARDVSPGQSAASLNEGK